MKKILIFLFFVFLILFFFFFLTKRPAATSLPHAPTVTIKGKTFSVEIARTEAEQEKGLGYKDSLPKDAGMVFPYDKPRPLTFWMKGMKFPIDIIFINNKTITTIYENVPIPTTANEKEFPLYHSNGEADMVLEINAGLAKEYGFHTEDTITLVGL